MAVQYEGREVKIGIAEESAFGTAIADSGSFTEIKTEPVEIDMDVRMHDIPGAAGTKTPLQDSKYSTTTGSMPKFTTNGPYSTYESDLFLYAACQKVTEAVDPYTKTFTPFTALPDFSADAGFFATWLKQYPTASTSWKVKSCIADRIRFSAARDELLQVETSWISPFAPTYTNNPNSTATWERGLLAPAGATAFSTQFGMLHFNDISAATINFEGAGANNMVLQSFNWEMSHEATGNELDGSGDWGNITLVNRAGSAELVFLKDAQFETALSNWGEDKKVEVVIRWGAAGATTTGELQMTLRGKINSIAIDQSGLLGGTIGIDLLAVSDSTDMIEVIQTSGQTRGW